MAAESRVTREAPVTGAQLNALAAARRRVGALARHCAAAGTVVSRAPALEEVCSFGMDAQPTGVAVSSDSPRRIFVTFPRWFEGLKPPSVAEIVDGELVPYPNAAYNAWDAKASDGGSASALHQWVCAQSVFIDHFNRLWVLDPGAAYLGETVTGGPKLVQIDLATDAVVRTYDLASVAPSDSYLNDVRISVSGRYAYITDSNLGGLKVVDLEDAAPDGGARNLLADHPSTHAEEGVIPTVEGQPMHLPDGGVATFQNDGIAVLNAGGHEFVFYHAVTARTLYRIRSSLLVDKSLSTAQVEAGVEAVCQSGIPDGFVVAGDEQLRGVLFMTAIEKNGIDYLSTDGLNRVLPFVSDALLQWPDSMSVPVIKPGSADNYLYITASQVNTAGFIKDAKPRRNHYALYRIRLPMGGVV